MFQGEEKHKLKYKAAQARLFLRLLPFILCTLIPGDDDYYALITELIALCQIMKLSTINLLKRLIGEHLKSFNIKPFITDRDSTKTANKWDQWKKNIERQFRFSGISDPDLKKDGLIIYRGEDISELEKSLSDMTATEF